jgi:chromosome segregation ATPase
MMDSRPERADLINLARDEERRRREEARQQALQAQIDELRHLIRELVSRQLRLEEELKASEADWAEQRQALEQHRHEVAQAAQARQLEEARFRQQLSELSHRIDESTRPIRSLQAHVAELLEAMRRQREDTGQDTRRYDELRILIDHLASHVERLSVVGQSLRSSIDAVTAEVERLGRELSKVQDGLRIVEQEVRRRVTEVFQEIESLKPQIKEGQAKQQMTQAQIEGLREDLETVEPRFSELSMEIDRLAAEIERVRSHALERDELANERLEELRQQFDVQLRDIAAISEQRHSRTGEQLDQLVAVDRELTYRVDLIEVRLEELREIDRQLRSELWRLQEQRARLRLEQAQQELERIIEARQQMERGEARAGESS